MEEDSYEVQHECWKFHKVNGQYVCETCGENMGDDCELQPSDVEVDVDYCELEPSDVEVDDFDNQCGEQEFYRNRHQYGGE
jgi:hypothetical protein